MSQPVTSLAPEYLLSRIISAASEALDFYVGHVPTEDCERYLQTELAEIDRRIEEVRDRILGVK